MNSSRSKWPLVLLCIALVGVCIFFLRAREFMAIDRCMDAGGAYEKAWKICDKSNTDAPDTRFSGPVFAGILDGKKIHLQLRDDHLGYRMINNGLRIVGDLNVERGLGKDDNAVIYVLDWTQDAAQHIRFLRVLVNGAEELQRIGPDQQLQKGAALRAK